MIWRNFFRDLRQTAPRMISVVLITMIAVMVYTGLNGVLYNADQITSRYFTAQNAADYWISGSGLDGNACRALAQIPGVTGVQPRAAVDAELKDNEDATLLLYAVPGDYAINTPYLMEGRLPAGGREIALSDVFAQAHGIAVGDIAEITLTGTDHVLRLSVTGLIKSPECVYLAKATMPMPDLSLYGFAYCDETVLTPVLGENQYTQICITTEDGADEEAIRRQVHQLLGSKVVSILSLEDNTAAYTLQSTADSLGPVLQIFPVLFFLCAVLLMVSNMDRLVSSGRSSIGTFKALGYEDRTILAYFLLYAALVVALAFPLGVLPDRAIAKLVLDTLATGCDLPPYALLSDYSSWAAALGLTALCCVGSAFLVTRSTLKESPAQCMRPKDPGKVRPVLLERLPALWNRLSYNQKYIIRNTMRSKARLLTSVIGIAFCMALVLAAFSLRDAVTHYTDALSSNQNRFDLMVDLGSGVTQGQADRLAASSLVTEAEFEMTGSCWLYSDRGMTTAAMTVVEDQVSLHLYDPYAQSPLDVPESGVILPQSTAEDLSVSVGDTVTVRLPGQQRYYAMTVVDTVRGLSGACVSRSFWRSLGQPYTPTGAYLTVTDRTAMAAELAEYGFVDGWQTRESIVSAAVDQLSSASLTAYILIFFGGCLACVVIYNLGIMSFLEQIRSLATLMVLGFYESEIKRLQLSENLIFAAVGICAGIPIGMALSHLIVAVLEKMPLQAVTTPLSLLLSCSVTALFALAVNGAIGRRMGHIDMLGALKSVE